MKDGLDSPAGLSDCYRVLHIGLNGFHAPCGQIGILPAGENADAIAAGQKLLDDCAA